MNYLKLPALFFLSMLISACYTTQGYKNKVDKFLGVSESALIADWGVPQRSHEVGKVKYLEYLRDQSYTQYIAPTYQTTYSSGIAYTTQTGGETYNVKLNCITTFTIRNGIVVSWNAKGNDCYDWEE